MATPRRHPTRVLCIGLSAATLALATAVACVVTLATTQSAQAQSYTVIHSFTGGADGGKPGAGLTIDRAGTLYGTTWFGGTGNGVVFKLFRRNSNWVLNPLYSFAGGNDGAIPGARVVFGPDGSLYGTTQTGGGTTQCYFGPPGHGCGTVFNLRPSATACITALCPWTETVLNRFDRGGGAFPNADSIFDPTGTLYSTTPLGGPYGDCDAEGDGCGTAYKLTRSGNNWNETVFYNFGQVRDASEPNGVIFDNAGNLYGTSSAGGYNFGTVFELMPFGSGWTETILFRFNGGSQGEYPSSVIIDNLGNLYGATSAGGVSGGGTVFELTQSGGIWTLNTLYSFAGSNGGPARSLVMDAAGNLYGTTYADGAHQRGNVFKLTHSNGRWTYASLYDFTGGSDGSYPLSSVAFDANGNLYGTTFAGGIGACNLNGITGCGVVWEITP